MIEKEIIDREPIIKQLMDKALEMFSMKYDEDTVRKTLIADLISNSWDLQQARSRVSTALDNLDRRARGYRSDIGKKVSAEINGQILDRRAFRKELYSRFGIKNAEQKGILGKFLHNLAKDIKEEAKNG
jgi:hypothetical protein